MVTVTDSRGKDTNNRGKGTNNRGKGLVVKVLIIVVNRTLEEVGRLEVLRVGHAEHLDRVRHRLDVLSLRPAGPYY